MRALSESITAAGRELTGWCYLVAGVAILAAAAIIPAQLQLDRARGLAAKAEAQVQLRRDMLDDAGARIAALSDPDDTLLHSLAQTHLNLGPAGARPIALRVETPTPIAKPASHAAPTVREPSSLERLVTESPARPVAIVLAAIAVLYGLLPASQPAPAEPSHAIS